MPTSEVIKRLNAAGLEVKAAATAVDEKLADAALTGKPKPKAIASNGAAKKPAAPVLQQRAGFGHGTARAPRAENLAPKTPPKPKAKPKPKPEAAATAPEGGRAWFPPSHAFLAAGRARSGFGRRRPPRRHRLAGLAPAGSRWRSRRSRWRPWWRSPESPAAPSRRPSPSRYLRGARRAGRLRPEGGRHPRRLRLDRQGRRRVARRRRAGDHQEADEPRRDGDAHADAVRRRGHGPGRRVRQGDRDRHGGRGRQRGARDRRRRRGPRAALAGHHDHGSRRPRQDVAAGRDPPDGRGRGRGRRHHPAHRRLPGPSGRRSRHHVPGHPGPRGVHRHACPRRPGDGHRRDRGRRRRRRAPADARGRRSREGRRRADRGRRQQDRQGGRTARPRPHRDDPARAPARGVGRRDHVRRRLGQDAPGPRGPARGPAAHGRARGAHRQPGRRRLRHRDRVQARSGPWRGRHRARPARHAEDRRRDRRRRPLGPRARDVGLHGQAREDGGSVRAGRGARVRHRARRPASSPTWSRTTARPVRWPASARTG